MFPRVIRKKKRRRVRLRNETIAHATNSQEVPRFRGMILDVASQADDKIINCARIGVFVQAPHIFQNRFPRYGASILAYQMAQKFGFHQRELDGVVGRAELEIIKINCPAVECEEVLVWILWCIFGRRG